MQLMQSGCFCTKVRSTQNFCSFRNVMRLFARHKTNTSPARVTIQLFHRHIVSSEMASASFVVCFFESPKTCCGHNATLC